MDSNKNEQCYTNGSRAAVIGVDCIGSKAVSAAKYQNQFNNNNLIEQENLMPPVHERVSGMGQDDIPSLQPNGLDVSELPVKEKILAENGSIRHISSIFLQSGSSHVSGSLDELPERLHDSFITNGTTSFNPPTNGPSSTTGHQFRSASPAASKEIATNSTGLPDEVLAEIDHCHDGKKLDCPPDAPVLAPLDDENEFSDNNSLGNLSYGSEENGLIEELILLPNNAFSDDDNASTSDDCIYAYRGGEPEGAAAQLLDLQGDLPPDDETDFLEMDFDPEPSSEMENFNRQQDFMLGLDDEKFGVGGAGHEEHEMDGTPRSPSLAVRVSPSMPLQHNPEESEIVASLRQVPELCERREVPCASPTAVQSHSIAPHDTRQRKTDIDGGSSCRGRGAQNNTGAIPKCLPISTAGPSGRSGVGSNLRIELDVPDGNNYGRQYQSYDQYQPSGEFGVCKRPKGPDHEEGEETHCLDCAEQEFLMQTKQDPTRPRFCKVCSANGVPNAKSERSLSPVLSGRNFYDRDNHFGAEEFHTTNTVRTVRKRDEEERHVEEDELLDLRAQRIVFETLHKINTLKEMPPESSRATDQQQRGEGKPNVPLNVPEAEEDSVKGGVLCHRKPPPVSYCRELPEQSVVIYTINCEKQTIMEAMMEIGITPNVDVLRQYFSDQYDIDTTKMTIPQYLLHMSKRDCNYKKLIDAIKSCCDPDTTLDFQYFPLDPFSDTPETVQISSCEIAKRWTANTNLRQIIHFKHKHFHTLNVLGKIVNILRQPSRGRHTNHTISIPRYYKSGCIRIRRIG
uniref:Uncharacterized protein n=1 Tax=Anopheles farauti TaxID=69004 RepID=A0A182QRP9_9DIPT